MAELGTIAITLGLAMAAYAAVASLAGHLTAAPELTVSDVAVTDRELFQACEEIVVGPNVSVLGPDGEAVFSAGQGVEFGDGLVVFADGTLVVATGLPLLGE